MRLSSKKDIGQLLEHGTVLFRYPFKLHLYPLAAGEGVSFVISVPKKSFKKAVDRNKIKRLTREAVRLNQSILSNFNANFLFVYIGKGIESFENVNKSIQELFSESVCVVEKTSETGNSMAVSDVD